MSIPNTFERVYATIKQWLVDGSLAPGQRLEPVHLAERVNSSVTPVRDALHRLTGERLVDAPRHEGFRVPLASEVGLRHLYAWQRDLLLMAVSNMRVDTSVAIPADLVGATRLARERGFFLSLAACGSNEEHLLALRSVLDRLGAFQGLEEALLDSLEEETAEIAAALEGRDRGRLKLLIRSYYRRRARVVPDLVARASARHEAT